MVDQIASAAIRLAEVAVASLFLIIVAIDELSFGQLAILTFVFRIFSDQLHPRQAPRVVVCTSTMLGLLYFGHRAIRDGDQFLALCFTVVRTYLAFWLIYSAVLPITIVLQSTIPTTQVRLLAICRAPITFLAVPLKAVLQRFRRRAPQPAPTEAPRRTLTKAERMELVATAARSEYDAEVALLATLPLDEDEQEVLVLQAKQRLLQKLIKLPEA